MAKKIRDLMTRGPIVLEETSTAMEAAMRMKEHDIGDVLVRGTDGNLRGIVTDRDLVVRCLAEKGGDAPGMTLAALCSSDVATLGANASIEDAVSLMEKRAVRRLPIVDGAEVIGIVSLGDLARERDPQSALGQISSAPASV